MDTYMTVNPTDIQSLLFDKAKWTIAKAKAWLKKNGFRIGELDEGGPKAGYHHFRQFDPKKKFRYITKMFGSATSGMKAVIEFRGKRPAVAANPAPKKRPTISCNNPAHAHFPRTGSYVKPGIHSREFSSRRPFPGRVNPTAHRNDPDGFRGGLGTSELHSSERTAPRIFRGNDPDPRAYRRAYAFGSSGRTNPSPYPETRARWQRERIRNRRAMR